MIQLPLYLWIWNNLWARWERIKRRLKIRYRRARKLCLLCGQRAELWVVTSKRFGNMEDWTLCHQHRKTERLSKVYGMSKEQLTRALFQ